MSGFDGDPFGPVDNPFEDPSVQKVAKQPSSVQRGLEEYNPFEQTEQPITTARPNVGYNGGAQPAVMQPTQENLPSYSRNAQQTVQPTQEDFQRRQEELEKKEAELRRREDELRNNPYNVRRNNWPPLPSNMCGLEPCFYQDINVEIPVDFQSVVRSLYHLWLFHSILMVANIVGMTACVFLNADYLKEVLLAVFYLLISTPFSFLCWYRPGYKAFKDDSSINFMVFFFIFFFQFLISVLIAIGAPDRGTCGLLTAINVFTNKKDEGGAGSILVGIIVLSVAFGFCAAAAMDIFLLSKVHRIYRSSNASMAKAQEEFTRGFLSSDHVRQAASNAAAAAVQAQFNQNNQPRY